MWDTAPRPRPSRIFSHTPHAALPLLRTWDIILLRDQGSASHCPWSTVLWQCWRTAQIRSSSCRANRLIRARLQVQQLVSAEIFLTQPVQKRPVNRRKKKKNDILSRYVAKNPRLTDEKKPQWIPEKKTCFLENVRTVEKKLKKKKTVLLLSPTKKHATRLCAGKEYHE